jgi:hypothetical protein
MPLPRAAMLPSRRRAMSRNHDIVGQHCVDLVGHGSIRACKATSDLDAGRPHTTGQKRTFDVPIRASLTKARLRRLAKSSGTARNHQHFPYVKTLGSETAQ